MGGLSFNWLWLIVAVVAITAFAQQNPKWGKWIFAIVIVSALLLASNKILSSVSEGVGKGV
jgi:hypothetical protein